MMKNIYLLLLALMVATGASAQKKDRIKGSKVVTVTQKETEAFENLEIEDKIEVYLVKGSVQSLEIEADDNLHEVIKHEMYGNTLRIYTTKDVTSSKKLSVRVTYTDGLKMVTAKHESIINALADLELSTVTIKNLDYSKSFLNVKSANFNLVMDDKSKAEVNLKAESAKIELTKNAEIKALITAADIKIDLYQKAGAIIEGDAANAQLRLDNNASFTGKKFTVKNMAITAESYTNCSIMVTESVTIAASGKSEIQLLGAPAVTMQKFADSAVLYKKEQ